MSAGTGQPGARHVRAAARACPRVPPAVPAVASHALAGVLRGAPQPALPLGAGRAAVYVEPADGSTVVTVSTPEAVRLPSALVVDGGALAAVARAPALTIGGGRLAAGATALVPRRWFDPRPRLAPLAPASLAGRLDTLAAALPPWHPEPGPHHMPLRAAAAALAQALAAGDGARAADAATALLGLGPGLTPAGDDVVAGALAALVLLRPADGDAGHAPRLRAALGGVVTSAARRTTALSAALLRHAARGETAAPAAALMHALAGRGRVRPAVDALLTVGHSSGHDLARGILAGGRAVLAGAGAPVPAGTA